jgi:sphingosine-1-phosphate phosphatase 1
MFFFHYGFHLGQSIKDIVQWPRPACPPVVRLQTKWSIEYGMPSTHAIISLALPFSILHYISNRYQVIDLSISYNFFK